MFGGFVGERGEPGLCALMPVDRPEICDSWRGEWEVEQGVGAEGVEDGVHGFQADVDEDEREEDLEFGNGVDEG